MNDSRVFSEFEAGTVTSDRGLSSLPEVGSEAETGYLLVVDDNEMSRDILARRFDKTTLFAEPILRPEK